VRYFVIGDTHWGAPATSRCVIDCGRPFDADNLCRSNWKRLVASEDMVIHVGDVAFTFADLKEFLNSLPGIKILVRGNHDSKSVSWYMRNGFSFACDGFIMSSCYFTHRPLPTLPEGASINIHGHVHNRYPRGYRKYPHSRLFALEYENYSPRIVSSFVSSIEKEEPYIPPVDAPEGLEDLKVVNDFIGEQQSRTPGRIKKTLSRWERIKQYFV